MIIDKFTDFSCKTIILCIFLLCNQEFFCNYCNKNDVPYSKYYSQKSKAKKLIKVSVVKSDSVS